MKLPWRLAAFFPFLCLAALLQSLTLSGCAALPACRPEVPVAGDTGHTLLDEWVNRSARNASLQGVARIRVQTPERTVSGTQVILAEEPDRLRAETLSPFGTPLLIMAANGTQLTVFLPSENLFYSGRATPENIGRFTRLPLRLADLIGILLAKPPLLGDRDQETFQLPEGGWRIELKSGPRRQELLFDADRRLVGVSYLQHDQLQLQLAYDDFAVGPGGLPRRIELALPLQQMQASLTFKELETNRQVSPELFVISPPHGAKIVALDETSVSGTSGTVGEPAREEPEPSPQEVR